jgi:YVTN family beta-propeller protein
MNANRIKFLIATAQITLLAAAGPVFAAGGKVYVADEESSTVSVIDAASFKKIGSIKVGQGPHNVQVTSDGKLLWVTNNGEPAEATTKMSPKEMPKSEHGAMAGSGAVWVIDTATDKVITKVPVGMHPANVVVAQDGRRAYVTNGGDNSVSVVDTSTQQVVETIAVGTFPHGIRISPDGRQAWVANLKGGTVSVIDTQTKKTDRSDRGRQGPRSGGFRTRWPTRLRVAV